MYNIKKMNYYFYIIFKLEKLKAPVAQWIRCFPPKEKIPGSSPGRGGFFWWIIQLSESKMFKIFHSSAKKKFLSNFKHLITAFLTISDDKDAINFLF